MEPVNATRTFLGTEPQWSAARIELDDVQGLWGGRAILLEGAGRVVVRLIQPAMLEHRYEFVLGEDERKGLLDLFVENDFLTIKPGERPGRADEARPTLILVNAAGESWRVAKWAGVKDERFDALYAAIAQLETYTQHLAPTYSGPHQ